MLDLAICRMLVYMPQEIIFRAVPKMKTMTDFVNTSSLILATARSDPDWRTAMSSPMQIELLHVSDDEVLV